MGLYGLCAQSLPDETVVSYSAQELPLSKILLDLSDLSGVNIAFKQQDLPDTLLNVQVSNETLENTLINILGGMPIKYQIVGNQIAVVHDEYFEFPDELTFQGYVQDSVTGERLLFATVFLQDGTRGIETNDYGYYSLSLPKGDKLLNVSYLGYERKIIKLKVKRDSFLVIDLAPKTLLNEIVIRDKILNKEYELNDLNDIPIDKMHSMVDLGGEADVMRTSYLLSGVLTGADGFGGMHVRGGETDQNQLLLDGSTIYNPGHALGIYSIFNPEIIKNAKLIKSAFPARYGGRLSSILDVRTREGSTKRVQGSVGISALAGNFTLEGPLQKDGSSFLISGRRTILDPWIKEFTSYQNNQNGNEGSANYYFYDLNGKFNFKMGQNHRLYFSVYHGMDDYSRNKESTLIFNNLQTFERSDDLWQWGNTLASLRWNMNFGKKLFINWTASYSLFDFELFNYNRLEETEDGSQNRLFYDAEFFTSSVTDISGRLDLEYLANKSYTLRFGLGGVQHEFSPGVMAVTRNDQLVEDDQFIVKSDLENALVNDLIKGDEWNGYIENEFRLGSAGIVNLGLHGTLIQTIGKDYYSYQPRAAIELNLGNAALFKASYSEMQQYLHLFTDSGFGLPSDVWLPSTHILRPQESWQAAGGLSLKLSNEVNWEFEGFYKELDHIITYSDNRNIPINQSIDWESSVPVGEGRAYGFETSLWKKAGALSGWINYTLSWSKRKFDEINNGHEYFARFDRRHNVNLALVFRINPNSEFTFNWTYGSGSRYTLIEDIFQANDSTLVVSYGDRNSGILPDHHRLDIGFNFYNKYSWGRQKISLGAYNAYNRRNPIYIDITRNDLDINNFTTEQVSIFPIIPSISYSLAF